MNNKNRKTISVTNNYFNIKKDYEIKLSKNNNNIKPLKINDNLFFNKNDFFNLKKLKMNFSEFNNIKSYQKLFQITNLKDYLNKYLNNNFNNNINYYYYDINSKFSIDIEKNLPIIIQIKSKDGFNLTGLYKFNIFYHFKNNFKIYFSLNNNIPNQNSYDYKLIEKNFITFEINNLNKIYILIKSKFKQELIIENKLIKSENNFENFKYTLPTKFNVNKFMKKHIKKKMKSTVRLKSLNLQFSNKNFYNKTQNKNNIISKVNLKKTQINIKNKIIKKYNFDIKFFKKELEKIYLNFWNKKKNLNLKRIMWINIINSTNYYKKIFIFYKYLKNKTIKIKRDISVIHFIIFSYKNRIKKNGLILENRIKLNCKLSFNIQKSYFNYNQLKLLIISFFKIIRIKYLLKNKLLKVSLNILNLYNRFKNNTKKSNSNKFQIEIFWNEIFEEITKNILKKYFFKTKFKIYLKKLYINSKKKREAILATPKSFLNLLTVKKNEEPVSFGVFVNKTTTMKIEMKCFIQNYFNKNELDYIIKNEWFNEE